MRRTIKMALITMLTGMLAVPVFAEESVLCSQDYDNVTTITTSGVLDWDLNFELLPGKYTDEEPEQMWQSEYLHYTTDVYEDGKTYDKIVRVYLPVGYDPEDTNTKYNVLYFQHGNSSSPNAFDGKLSPGNGIASTNPTYIFNHMLNNGDIDPFILVCTTYYLEITEDTGNGNGNRAAGDGRYEGVPGNFYREVVEDIIPAVEGHYNTYCEDISEEGIMKSRDHRAWAGYSRGSVCTWYMFHNNLAYFKYFMPTSAECMPGDLGEDTNDEDAFQFLKEAIDEHPDLDFFIFASSGGERDAPNMRSQIRYFVNQTDTFSFGKNTKENNIYYTCSDFIHADVYFPYYLYNARDILFK